MRGVARCRAGAHGAIFGMWIQTIMKKYLSFVTLEHVIIYLVFMNCVNILPKIPYYFAPFTGKVRPLRDQKLSAITMFCY